MSNDPNERRDPKTFLTEEELRRTVQRLKAPQLLNAAKDAFADDVPTNPPDRAFEKK